MLPRLRFVVASLVIAVLPMVFLGAGLAPSAHPTSPAELSRADKPVVLGPTEYSETQYRLDRIALSYARRENELGKLRRLAAAPLANWIAAPAGAATDSDTSTVATVTTDGPAVVTVNTTKPENTSDVTVSVTVSPADKAEKTDKAPEAPAPSSSSTGKPAAAAEPEATKPAASKPDTAAAPAADSMSDVPRAAVTAPSGQVFAALTPPKTETSKTEPAKIEASKTEAAKPETSKTETAALPQVHVVAPHAKPKPRPRVARKPKPTRTPPPAAQKPPPFFELFVWLFNLKPDAHGQLQAGSASQLQQQQPQPQPQPQAHSFTAPATGVKTASRP